MNYPAEVYAKSHSQTTAYHNTSRLTLTNGQDKVTL